MGLSQGFLAVKLYEMEKQYGKLQSRLLICGEKNHLRIQKELERARDEYQEQLLTLQREVEQSRSQAVKDLSQIQLSFYHKMEELKKKLSEYFRSEETVQEEDGAEAAALYAEYAVDHAVQSMQYAFIAALEAMDAQMTLEEQKGEESTCRK